MAPDPDTTTRAGRKAQNPLSGFMFRLSKGPELTPESVTAVEARLLGLCLGQPYRAQDIEASRLFLDHLESRVSRETFGNALSRHLLPSYHPSETRHQRILCLMCDVLDIYRTSCDMSIDRVLWALCTDRSALKDTPAARCDPELKLLLFSIIGWTTKLFEPLHHDDAGSSFSIGKACPAANVRTSVPIDKARRPLDELLRAFGDLLPGSRAPQGEDDPSVLFQVSSLNAKTLQSIGNISINWTDSMDSHLSFDPAGRSLSLFRLPSVCKLQQSNNSLLAILSQSLYLENEEPDQDYFSIPKLMGELLLSYSLVFRDSRSSRLVYRKSERRRAAFEEANLNYKVDPTLDDLCGFNDSKSGFSFDRPVRDVYDSRIDFPIFKDRLSKLQIYMQGIQPSKTLSLWRDRRDLRLWYTVWLVVILGGISIIQSFVSIALAVAQLRVAEHAYNLQKTQESP